MNHIFGRLVAAASLTIPACPALATQDTQESGWISQAWNTATEHVSTTWDKGDIELYLPIYTWHLPFAYTPDQRSSYTEIPGGFGLGKGRYNDSGNWEGIYAMGFRDSHGDPSFMLGYGWIPTWNVSDTDVKVGVGLTAFFMSRQDYFGGFPFPAVLPIASASYRNLSLQAAYVPGGKGNGNVLFIWGKWTFN